MSISRSVSVSIQAGLDEIFAADVSGTLTLGFDWSKTSSLTKDKSTTVDVTEDVEPGNSICQQIIITTVICNEPRESFVD